MAHSGKGPMSLLNQCWSDTLHELNARALPVAPSSFVVSRVFVWDGSVWNPGDPAPADFSLLKLRQYVESGSVAVAPQG